MAKWINPQKLAALDPQHTLQEINQQFLGMPLQGSYWISEQK